MRVTLFAIIALTLCSCPSTPPGAGERQPVPADRVFDSALLTASPERSCPVTVTRDKGFVSGGVALDIFMDGHRIARVRTAESITVYTSPGRHFVGVKYTWGSAYAPGERDITARPNQPISLRITVNSDGDLDVKPQSELL
jgi:hypothetical protein